MKILMVGVRVKHNEYYVKSVIQDSMEVTDQVKDALVFKQYSPELTSVIYQCLGCGMTVTLEPVIQTV